MSLRSPIGRVLGNGSAKSGVGHWSSQRITAIALVFLALWFVASLLSLPDFTYFTVQSFIGAPVNAVLLTLLAGTAAYHSFLGVQVVVEDYVHGHGLKTATILLLIFLHVAVAAFGIFAVLRIAFAGMGLGATV